jgi:hypothetical protein
MVPTSLILTILVVAFFPATFAYFFAWPERRIANIYFPIMAAPGLLMLLSIGLVVLRIEVVWLSWVLLATAIFCAITAICMLRPGLALLHARERAADARRARRR